MKTRLLTALFVIAVTTTSLDHCSCTTTTECDQQLKDSLKTFASELKAAVNHSTSAEDHQDYQLTYEQICGNEGPTKRFEASVKKAQTACTGQLSTFTYQLCEVRLLKLGIGRYTWTPSLLLDLCNRTLPFFNADFLRHEQCIARVLNGWRSACDRLHYNLVKASTGEKQCGHWADFRDCALAEVEKACGNVAANVSDHLLHRHATYFADYRACGFAALEHHHQAEAMDFCWYRRPPVLRMITEQLKNGTAAAAAAPVETVTEDLGGVEPGDDNDDGDGGDDNDGDVKIGSLIRSSADSTTRSVRWTVSLLAASFLSVLFVSRVSLW